MYDNEKYDVIVVGAGPAGASTARRVAESNYKVLIIERKKEIGHPVQCGELVPDLNEFSKILPKTDRAKRLFDIPSWVISNKCSKVAVLAPSKKIHEFSFNSNIVDRSRFDKWLVMKASKAGAKTWIHCKAINADSDGRKVVVKKEGKIRDLRTNILVAADGPSSKMVKDVGLSSYTPANFGITIEYLMGEIDIDPEVVEVYFGNDYAPGAYAWIIPKGEGIANVGLGIRKTFSQKGISIRDYITRFIYKHPIASKKLQKGVILSKIGGLVPINGPIKKTYGMNVIAVGDAAGQVMATNGSGIPTAVICGDIGGEAIVNKLEGKSSLAYYEEKWKNEVGKQLSSGVKIRKMIDLTMKSDRFSELAFEFFGSKIVEGVMLGNLSTPLNIISKTFNKLIHSNASV